MLFFRYVPIWTSDSRREKVLGEPGRAARLVLPQEMKRLIILFPQCQVQSDYCQLPCGEVINTGCEGEPWKCGRRSNCNGSVPDKKLNKQEENLTLYLHNYYRNKVALGKEKKGGNQPTAADMFELTYDDDLAYLAQCFTNTCKSRHDKCRKTEKYISVGQNLGTHSTSAKTFNRTKIIKNLIRRWYNEVTEFKVDYIEKFKTSTSGLSDVGHYTQLVWSQTKQIGCGLTVNIEGENTKIYFACNYGPMGNIRNSPVYKIGEPRSNCTDDGNNENWPGLCKPVL